MEIERITELLLQYLEDSGNIGDFYNWASDKGIDEDDLYYSIGNIS